MAADLPRPLQPLPVAAGAADLPTSARHRTVLPPEPADAVADLAAARRDDAGIAALAAVCARHPAFIEGWARLGEAHLRAGDTVVAYACARVAYHRGLDRLRRSGWGGTGLVQWSAPTNRGFLRGLRLLLATGAELGERDEASRCRQFLLDLDPDDGIGAAATPTDPGPGDVVPPAPDDAP